MYFHLNIHRDHVKALAYTSLGKIQVWEYRPENKFGTDLLINNLLFITKNKFSF